MVKYRTPTKTTCLNFARSLLSFVPSTSTVISLMDMRPYAHPSQTPYSHRSVIKPVLTLSFKPSISSPRPALHGSLSALCPSPPLGVGGQWRTYRAPSKSSWHTLRVESSSPKASSKDPEITSIQHGPTPTAPTPRRFLLDEERVPREPRGAAKWRGTQRGLEL